MSTSVVIFQRSCRGRCRALAELMGGAWTMYHAMGVMLDVWGESQELKVSRATGDELGFWGGVAPEERARFVAALLDKKVQFIRPVKKSPNVYVIVGNPAEIKKVKQRKQANRENARRRWDGERAKSKTTTPKNAENPSAPTDSGSCESHATGIASGNAAGTASGMPKLNQAKLNQAEPSRAKPPLSNARAGVEPDPQAYATAARLVHAAAAGRIEHVDEDDARDLRKGYTAPERFVAAMRRIFTDPQVTSPEAYATRQVAIKLMATRDYPDPADFRPPEDFGHTLSDEEDDHAPPAQ